MTVYVDNVEWSKPNGRKKYAHMTADSLEELHTFAENVGIKKHWFHRGSRYPHYDINADQHAMAIANGAMLIRSPELVKIAKHLYGRL